MGDAVSILATVLWLALAAVAAGVIYRVGWSAGVDAAADRYAVLERVRVAVDAGSRGRHPSRLEARGVDEWAAVHYPSGWSR